MVLNEGEPTLDRGLEAQRGGTRVVRLSLEIEDSPVCWLYGRSRGQGGFLGQGTEHQAPPCHGDAPTVLQQEPAQEMRHHGTTAWNDGRGESGEGKAQDGPKNYCPYPCVNFWVKGIKDEPNSPSDLLER